MTAAESAAAPDQLLKAWSVAVRQVCSTENPTALSLGDLPTELCHLWQIFSPTLPPPTPSHSQKCLIIPLSSAVEQYGTEVYSAEEVMASCICKHQPLGISQAMVSI